MSISFFELVHASLPLVFIKNCYDGDTCTSGEGEKIRLACIDSPELNSMNSDFHSAILARDFLNSLLVNQEVSINRITHDKYGRTVAELFKEKLNVQELLVEKGHAKIHKSYAHQCDWTKHEH